MAVFHLESVLRIITKRNLLPSLALDIKRVFNFLGDVDDPNRLELSRPGQITGGNLGTKKDVWDDLDRSVLIRL